jgi:DNA replication protein DnaC
MSEWRGTRYWRNRPTAERLKNAHVPKRFVDKSFDNYNAEQGSPDVLDYVRQWWDNYAINSARGEGLYLFGGPGSGKTHIAVATLNEVIVHHNACGFFITAEKFVEASYDEMKNDDELPDIYGEPFLLKYINSVYEILVLDNLGGERLTDFTKQVITSMLNSRYENQLITIITSEIPPKKLDSIYGPRLASILAECCLSVPFLGSDYRKRELNGEG